MNYYNIPQYFLDGVITNDLSASSAFIYNLSAIVFNNRPISEDFQNFDSTYTTVNTNSASWGGGSSTTSIVLSIISDDVILSGVKGYVTVPFNGTITQWNIISDVVDTLECDVWRNNITLGLPTSSNSITGNQKVRLNNSTTNLSTNLSSWTVGLTSGDIVGFSLTSAVTAATKLVVTLTCNKI